MNLLLILSLVTLDYRPVVTELSGFGRSTAAGGASVGFSDDATAVFANPAGPDLDGLQFGLTDWYLDTRLASGAGAFRLRNWVTVAAGLNYLNYGELTRWDEQGNRLGTFSPYSLNAKLAVNRSLTNYLTAGLGVGYAGERVDSTLEGSVAGDVGVRFHQPRFGAGLAVRDFMGGKTPFMTTLGLYGYPLKSLLLTAGVEYVKDVRLRAGAEYRIAGLALRAGWDGLNPCAGLGFSHSKVSVDYALVIHRQLGLAHQLSLGINR